MANSKYSVVGNDFFKDMGQLNEEQLYMKQIMDRQVSSIPMQITFKKEMFSCMNTMLHNFGSMIMPYEMHVYGSSVEGLACYTRNDIGDVDVMITAEEAVLDESMLEYVDGEPAFVRVRGKDHPLLQKCLHGETNFVATSTLKQLDPTIFGWASMFEKLIPLKFFGAIPQVHTPNFEISNISQALDNPDGPSFQLDFKTEFYGPKHQIPIESVLDIVPDYSEMPDIQRFFVEMTGIDTTQDAKELQDKLFNYLISPSMLENLTNEDLLKALAPEKYFNTLKQFLELPNNGLNDHVLYKEDPEDKEILKKAFSIIKHVQPHKPWDVQKQDNELQEKPMKSGIDYVPSFKVKGWPQVAEGWFERDRKWPSFEALSNIRKGGFHLVFKSPKHGNTTPHLDFRLSFSHAELLLSKELNDIQRECYRCLKLFYKALNQNKEPKIISSYVLKTTLLWSVEKTGTEMWNENNRASCVMMLLEKLHHSLETKFLPHYFIPEFNLLEEAVIEDPQRLQNLADELREICDHPIEFYRMKLMPDEINTSSSEEFKEKSQSLPEDLVKQSGAFQLKVMPKEEFSELYIDVSNEIACWVKCGRCSKVEDHTMQSIVSFLHEKVYIEKFALSLNQYSGFSKVYDSIRKNISKIICINCACGSDSSESSESSEVDDDLIHEVVEEWCLLDLDFAYFFFHFMPCNGLCDPRERILSLFKNHFELYRYLQIEENESDINAPRSFVNTYQSVIENVLEASLNPLIKFLQKLQSKNASEDDIPLD